MKKRRAPVLAAAVLCAVTIAPAAAADNQTDEDDEDVEQKVVVGVGGAGELELGDGTLHPGVNVMVEVDAIENWLELELGASVLAAEGGVEVPVDLLFKKPFRLSRRVEMFVGLGPEVVPVSNPTKKTTYFGMEFALDFFYWPYARVGFWIEPSYDFIFRDGISHGVGSTGGVVFGW